MLLVKNMKAIGLLMNRIDREPLHFQMELVVKDFTEMVKLKNAVNSGLLAEMNTKGIY